MTVVKYFILHCHHYRTMQGARCRGVQPHVSWCIDRMLANQCHCSLFRRSFGFSFAPSFWHHWNSHWIFFRLSLCQEDRGLFSVCHQVILAISLKSILFNDSNVICFCSALSSWFCIVGKHYVSITNIISIFPPTHAIAI